jgi:hypothetical protein
MVESSILYIYRIDDSIYISFGCLQDGNAIKALNASKPISTSS